MREKSDSRTTLDKVGALREDLRVLVNLAQLGSGMVDETVLQLDAVKARVASVFNLIDMIEEEVDVMTKCQYEMRKTIKSKIHAVADNQPLEDEG